MEASVTVTLRKADEADYWILIDGVTAGRVYRTWFRLGGDSWTTDGRTGRPTRKAAVDAFVRKLAKGTS